MPVSDIKSGGNWTSGLTQNDTFYVLKIGCLPEVSIFIVLMSRYLNFCREVLFEL